MHESPLKPEEVIKHLNNISKDIAQAYHEYINIDSACGVLSDGNEVELAQEEIDKLKSEYQEILGVQYFDNAILFRNAHLFLNEKGYFILTDATTSGSIINYKDRNGNIFTTGLRNNIPKDKKIKSKKYIPKSKLGCDAKDRLTRGS